MKHPSTDPTAQTPSATPHRQSGPSGLDRRSCLLLGPALLLAGATGAPGRTLADPPASTPAALPPRALAALPAQDPDRVFDMVGASHGRIERVRELLRDEPRLANACVDWGFGDWETAIGAASHVGNRAIADILLEHGARPDHFTLAMLGRLDALKAVLETQPGLQRTLGPHGITLLAHARAGGPASASVVEYLTALGGADDASRGVVLPDDLRSAVIGTYAFGSAPDERFEISEKNNALWVTRATSKIARGLTYLGDGAFHPAGAPEVRLAFTLDPAPPMRASHLRITAPRPIIEARRV